MIEYLLYSILLTLLMIIILVGGVIVFVILKVYIVNENFKSIATRS